MEIKNRDEIIDELTEMLMNFDKDMNRYQTDVYCYLDDEGNATLEEFVNVGGNSWLNDDHHVIYIDNQHYEDEFDCIPDISAMALSININEEQLIREAAEYNEIDEDDVDYSDVVYYIKHNDEYMDKIHKAYCDDIDEQKDNYYYKACDLVDELERKIDEENEYREMMEE